MRRMGLNTSGDAVYPDLALALPTPRDVPVVAGMVGVGVMNYNGSECATSQPTNSLRCPRCSSDQPNRRRPRPDTSVLAQIFSGSSLL
jgi:hypothetical protein